jgi:DUF4097 and DUF4098 domain-containing protein YvlB
MKHQAAVLFALAILPLSSHTAAAQDERLRIRNVVKTVTPVMRYQRGGEREEQTERTTRVLKIGSSGELDVSNIAGDIVVSRGNGNEATVEIVKTARARTAEEAREMLRLVQVEADERNARGEIRTRYPTAPRMRAGRGNNINVTVAFTITVPAGTRLTVKSVSGSVTITDIKGDISAESISGSVSLANAARISSAKAVSGDVSIADTNAEGSLDAGSISGNVILKRVRGSRLNVGSVSGNITLEDVSSERIDAQSVSGNVEFSGPLAKNGRYDVKSHAGDVRLAIAGGTGFELDANSFSGSVRADTNLTLKSSESPEDRRGRRRALRGTFGDGSAMLDISTFSGDIVITTKR